MIAEVAAGLPKTVQLSDDLKSGASAMLDGIALAD
jgi:hypothetical protein